MELKGFITNLGKYNEGELVGEWITFPIDDAELQKVLDRIGINAEYEEYFFTDFDMPVELRLDEFESIETLNELGEVFENSDDDEKIEAVLEIIGTQDRDYVIGVLENIDGVEYINAKTEEDLGYYLVDMIGVENMGKDTLESYFDYESFGADAALESYSKTSNGYVRIN